MTKIVEALHLDKKAGEIGIEIEIEGDRLGVDCSPKWVHHQDQSLRGNSAEFVLRNPVKRENVDPYLEYLQNLMKENNTRIKITGRSGVHVHVNCQQDDLNSLMNFMSLYLIFEEVLINWCGKDRIGNLFCLSAKDAEATVLLLQRMMRDGSYYHIKQLPERNYKYSAMNLCSLRKFGSLEFRCMSTTKNFADIGTWVKMLLAVKDASKEFANPAAMVAEVSGDGEYRFAKRIFGDLAELLDCPDFEDKVREGARIVQNYAFIEKKVQEDDEEWEGQVLLEELKMAPPMPLREAAGGVKRRKRGKLDYAEYKRQAKQHEMLMRHKAHQDAMAKILQDRENREEDF